MRLEKLTCVAGALLVVASTLSVPVLADHHHHRNWNRIDDQMAWEDQREVYRHNWKRLKKEHKRALEQEMRAQWLAYHHNNWNGQYNWNMYQEPGFLDYLHTNNPSLLTRMGQYMGL